MNTEQRAAEIRALLQSARKNVLAWPNESSLVRQNCHRLVEFQLAAIWNEDRGSYDAIQAEVQDAWLAINQWREQRRREVIDQALNYKRPRSEGGKA